MPEDDCTVVEICFRIVTHARVTVSFCLAPSETIHSQLQSTNHCSIYLVSNFWKRKVLPLPLYNNHVHKPS